MWLQKTMRCRYYRPKGCGIHIHKSIAVVTGISNPGIGELIHFTEEYAAEQGIFLCVSSFNFRRALYENWILDVGELKDYIVDGV